MKVFVIFLLCGVMSLAIAETVEEAWAVYQAKPKVNNADWPSYIEFLPNFEAFKERWDTAKAYNGKYSSTDDAWAGYKAKYRINYSPEENASRFAIFKREWEALVAHNERYARGEIYYPNYTDYLLDETEEERRYRESLPVH